MEQRPSLRELNHLHERLSLEQRDELLQCLLIAAPRGGEAMIKVLEDELLRRATEELIGGPLEGDDAGH
jgi:hypothetical protein